MCSQILFWIFFWRSLRKPGTVHHQVYTETGKTGPYRLLLPLSQIHHLGIRKCGINNIIIHGILSYFMRVAKLLGYVTPCFQSKFPKDFLSLYGSKQKKTKSPLVRPFLWASISKRRTTSPRADITITVGAKKSVLFYYFLTVFRRLYGAMMQYCGTYSWHTDEICLTARHLSDLI